MEALTRRLDGVHDPVALHAALAAEGAVPFLFRRTAGRAVIVVGNSIIQGMEFRVDHLIAQIAERRGLYVEDIHIVRTKRVGNSIIDSVVRNGQEGGHKQQTQLYDAAVILRA